MVVAKQDSSTLVRRQRRAAMIAAFLHDQASRGLAK